MDKSKKLLNDEIEAEIKRISSLPTGSEEKAKAIEHLSILYKLKIEESKSDIESEDRKKDRIFRLGMDAAGLIFPLAFYGIWMRKGFKFEETGTFTSQTFRNLFNRFKPSK